MIDKVQESHLYIWLRGKNSKFLNKLEEVIDYDYFLLGTL